MKELISELYNRIADDFFFCDHSGLINGQLGLCINLYEWGRFVNDSNITDKADRLIDSVISSLTIGSSINPKSISMGFSSGLLGTGWGIEYLAQREFVENNTNEILADLDERTFLRRFTGNDKNLNFEDGFLGIGYYYSKRLQNSIAIQGENNTHILKIKQNLVTYIAEMFGRKEQVLHSKENLALPKTIAVLADLYKLNIFNHKISRTLEWYAQNLHLENIKDEYAKLALICSLVKVHIIGDMFCKKIFSHLIDELRDSLDNDKLIRETDGSVKIFEVLENITFLLKNEMVINNLSIWKALSIKHLNNQLSGEHLKNKQIVLDTGLLDGYSGFKALIPILEKEI